MTAPPPPAPAPSPLDAFLRKLAAAAVVGLVFFAVLWYTVFSAMTAALIAAGGTGLIVAGAGVSDIFESIWETLANIILAILAAILAALGAILSIFN